MRGATDFITNLSILMNAGSGAATCCICASAAEIILPFARNSWEQRIADATNRYAQREHEQLFRLAKPVNTAMRNREPYRAHGQVFAPDRRKD